MLFYDRAEAGRALADKLTAYAGRPDVLVLALPRGGVPVAYEVARALGAPLGAFPVRNAGLPGQQELALGAPLDGCLVRKLGLPGQQELAMGAIATGGVCVLNQELVRALGVSEAVIDAAVAEERQELERRERAYRGDRPAPDVRGRTVIL